MHVSAKADYAIRALTELAAAGSGFVTVDRIADAQAMPSKFLEAILTTVRKAGLVESRRGAEGGYRLARDADRISIADVIRAVDGPLADIRGQRPEATSYVGAAAALPEVWVALRAAVRRVLETVTLADVVSGQLPDDVAGLTRDPGAWATR